MERNIRDQLPAALAPEASIPRATSPPSPSTAGRTATPTNTTHCGMNSGSGGETPCEVARKPFGRISIANADAGAYAYTDGAIDQAWRAVKEITKAKSGQPRRHREQSLLRVERMPKQE